MLMYVYGCTRLVVQPYYTLWNILLYMVLPCNSELSCQKRTKFGLFQGKYRRSDAENIGSVCLMVREKIGLQTDRHGDNISVFFPMRKKALKKDHLVV